MQNPAFPWFAARGAPDLFANQLDLYEKTEQRIEWLCRHIGIRDIDEAKSRVLAKLVFATRRATRAAWALSDGAVLPLQFWHLAGLREIWNTLRKPPRLRKIGRDRVKALLHSLWKQLEVGTTVTAHQALDAFAATGSYSTRISTAMLDPAVTAQLDKLPTSVLLAAALEEAEGASGDHGANPKLSFADWASFAIYIDKAVRSTNIDAWRRGRKDIPNDHRPAADAGDDSDDRELDEDGDA
jgi:hypothetical protein